MHNQKAANKTLILGRLGSVYGVHGWLKIITFTDPDTNIFNHPKWTLSHARTETIATVLEHKKHGGGFIALLDCCTTREIAKTYTNANIIVSASSLPALSAGEYYWKDLIGLSVFNQDNILLGTVDHLFETGSNDVICVKGERERYIPYLPDVVRNIDLAQGRISIEWDPEF